ncbi:MAG: N-acetyltransferase [Zetaproteobacteria bacterium]|nr:MAG: N-acetyltransferase [Zetaproteobacteria bacterium]
MKVREAAASEAEAIAALIHAEAERGVLLPRDADDVLEHLTSFVVAEEAGELAGAAALHPFTPELAEVRSLVVAERYRGRGVGRLLVQGLEARARRFGIRRIFALTYVPAFFERLGYRRIVKESLPHKVWTVCVHCPKFSCCDEVAVLKDLEETP